MEGDETRQGKPGTDIRLSQIAKGYWAKFTPEQRSQIMRERSAKGRKNGSHIGRPKKVKPAASKKSPEPKKDKQALIAESLRTMDAQDRQSLCEHAATLMSAHLGWAETLESLIRLLSK